jgi:hypothetical protein
MQTCGITQFDGSNYNSLGTLVMTEYDTGNAWILQVTKKPQYSLNHQ